MAVLPEPVPVAVVQQYNIFKPVTPWNGVTGNQYPRCDALRRYSRSYTVEQCNCKIPYPRLQQKLNYKLVLKFRKIAIPSDIL